MFAYREAAPQLRKIRLSVEPEGPLEISDPLLMGGVQIRVSESQQVLERLYPFIDGDAGERTCPADQGFESTAEDASPTAARTTMENIKKGITT